VAFVASYGRGDFPVVKMEAALRRLPLTLAIAFLGLPGPALAIPTTSTETVTFDHLHIGTRRL
jgi:hypothetical protein